LDPGLAATDPDAVQRARLRPAEDFIRLNWNKPQRIDLLAELCGISSRVLFRDFERVHSCSPAAYAKRVRLARVREMLLKGEASVTVMAVAFSGGFSNLGHFSRDYRILFGELPSATLKRARLAGRSAEA
jgi:transcriptional regulator GlxA family with amidase domain